ncbi:hypothetical protein [Mycobacterium intracellulare]|uniref:hypothetical protein n=1 Tax=Mycobacterium intracellulare TaxID=1767 RepID=UPI001EEE5827|nr:hypothetical protein [Mycobacterium intracellulare]MEE3754441.1 hypothetical protein [Mycobacterium intracellulare]
MRATVDADLRLDRGPIEARDGGEAPPGPTHVPHHAPLAAFSLIDALSPAPEIVAREVPDTPLVGR